MRLEKIGNELELILLLTDNHNYTAKQLAELMHISRRNLYYYLDYFRKSGFAVINDGIYYRISTNSRFFKQLHNNIVFTIDEARYLRQILEDVNIKDLRLTALKAKIDRYYGFEGSFSPAVLQRIHNHVRILKEAMEVKKLVMLKGYSSPHSKTVSDRVVEPFLLLNNELDIRCYEMLSGMCKTFKLSRVENVEILDVYWENESKHRQVYTDIFMFSGDTKIPIKLRLGQLAYNVLIEEYPMSIPFTHQDTNNHKHWIFETEVVSYLGVGRFVLGLYHDIEILDNNNFKQYIAVQIAQMNEKLNSKSFF